jgi:hypothetical protein
VVNVGDKVDITRLLVDRLEVLNRVMHIKVAVLFNSDELLLVRHHYHLLLHQVILAN